MNQRDNVKFKASPEAWKLQMTEWGQEGVGTEGRQDKEDTRDATPKSPAGSFQVDTTSPSEVLTRTHPGIGL